MNIVQLTPGAGAMYCGNCLRDNALVKAWRRGGHEVVMIPLYLPLTLDEPDQSAGAPLFFGGISVYLEQQSAVFGHAPGWFHDLLASPRALRWAGKWAGRTRPAELGAVTLSMLRGEEGRQAPELDRLLDWLKRQAPKVDVLCLSNALLLGMAQRLRRELAAPLICFLQGEDSFLDALPETHRQACWNAVAERAAEIDQFIAPTRYFAERMMQRLALPADRVAVVPNGINLEGFRSTPARSETEPPVKAPVLGYFARMCAEKGLGALVDAFLALRQRDRVRGLKLRVGGTCGPADEPFVGGLRRRLEAAGLAAESEFCPNIDRPAKIDFLHSLSVFSVPALYGEAFGLYIVEAMAAGVPVVQPRTASFPELMEATGGGILVPPGDATALAEAIEGLLLDPGRARALGRAGRTTVFDKFSAKSMAEGTLGVFNQLLSRRAA